MLELTFQDARYESRWTNKRGALDSTDLEVDVEATFSLVVAGEVVFEEPMFTIVELRMHLDHWLRRDRGETDFEFLSVEHDEPGLVWFRRQPSGGWRAGSIWQDRPAFEEFGWPALVDAVDRYNGRVDAWVLDNLGVRVADFPPH